MKCFVWYPKNISEEPHYYLLIEDYREYVSFTRRIERDFRFINIKIDETYLNGEPKQCHIIKKARFLSAIHTHIAENWDEGFIKYHFPKHAIIQSSIQTKHTDVFRFFITESEFLTSKTLIHQDYTGEIKRHILSKISIIDEVTHLGIASICTDKYIGDNESNILEICPVLPTASLMGFYKNIKPIADLILLLSSFAERRRLNWYKCDGEIEHSFVQNYNTRTAFYKDEERIPLIEHFSFEDFLKTSLQNIQPENIIYITRLLQSYQSGIDYSINAKIILWNAILEKILKKHFKKKNDEFKASLLKKMNVYIFDLSPMKELTDIRNDIAHGDDRPGERLWKLFYEWEILIQRVLLQELRWLDLSKTDVMIKKY